MTKREKLRKKLTDQLSILLDQAAGGRGMIPPEVKTGIDSLVDSMLEISDLPKAKSKEKTAGSKVWDSYKAAYDIRYPKAEIAPNAPSRTFCKRLADLVGEDVAIPLAAFFVQQNDSDLMRDAHPLNYLVHKHQKYLVRMRTGRNVTQDHARQAERVGASAHAGADYLRRKHGPSS